MAWTSRGRRTGDVAAVEVAAYRIVGEALTNVARHAGALRLELEDDGRGLSPERGRGVGIASMLGRDEKNRP